MFEQIGAIYCGPWTDGPVSSVSDEETASKPKAKAKAKPKKKSASKAKAK